MKYQLVESAALDRRSSLQQQVQALIDAGWEPLGGVAVSITMNEQTTGEVWAQAMINREFPDPMKSQ